MIVAWFDRFEEAGPNRPLDADRERVAESHLSIGRGMNSGRRLDSHITS